MVNNMRKWMWVLLAALALAPTLAAADSGVVETSLARNPRVRGGLGQTVEEAWPKYQAAVASGQITNDLLALTGRNLGGQDETTTQAFGKLWEQQRGILKAKTPAEAGVTVVTIVVRGEGGQLIPREVVDKQEIPLPIFGMSWGSGSVTHGLVGFRRAGTFQCFAKGLVIGEGSARRALRLLTWFDCGNSSITLPNPQIEKVVETKVETKEVVVTLPAPAVPVEPVVTTAPPTVGRTQTVYIDRPVPGPTQIVTKTEYVDRWREIKLPPAPTPTARVEITPVILADSRRQVSGPGIQIGQPGKISVGPSWAVNAAATWWHTPATATSVTCPTPTTPPNPTTLPGDTPSTPTTPTDPTLPPEPGGVPTVDGPGGAVNTPGASDPNDFPPGSVVVPIASPGSAAANAASLLPS